MPAQRSFLQGLVGVFGFPVAENPTQAMIEPAFADLGLDWRYLTVEVPPDRLPDAVRGARAMGWRGFNCTIPHKVAVIPMLDALSPAAEAIGAVNCVVLRDGQAIGENTDGKGFLQSLSSVRPVAGSRVVILGAGGAARAIGMELALSGASDLTIVNRTAQRGADLASRIRERSGVPCQFVPWEGRYRVGPEVDVLINATSIGLFSDVDALPAVDLDALRPGLLVCDVIPNPPRTPLLREAEARGCRTLDGLGMLVNQGVIGIQLWTGLDPRPEVMREALLDVFQPDDR
ncbi:shikimate dehydrogenase [Tautonia sociabilis]|uniref:Shikimate dehydrogenase (NADP(+)) n=1 Tax=Tautonia sociabilis TaxID=2080755 RepID=A0A432MRZ8_9BACT|nr:shikimate dehydrogenase [Tautonia sociabilis]RUL89736.1 shikimate dehydrogenase [Tautonia sociabilis]